mgnify:FL=1
MEFLRVQQVQQVKKAKLSISSCQHILLLLYGIVGVLCVAPVAALKTLILLTMNLLQYALQTVALCVSAMKNRREQYERPEMHYLREAYRNRRQKT